MADYRFTSEVLTQLKLLRLCVFSDQQHAETGAFDHAEASLTRKEQDRFLQLDICSAGRQHQLMVPVPDLYTYDARSLTHQVRPDFIEVKLRILQERKPGAAGVSPQPKDRGLVTDEANEELIGFCCKACGCRLMKTSIRKCLPLPSTHWSELAENWFCGTCCSGGGEKALDLQQRMQAGLSLRPGVCLVGTATLVLHASDLEGADSKSQTSRSVKETMLHVGKLTLQEVSQKELHETCEQAKDLKSDSPQGTSCQKAEEPTPKCCRHGEVPRPALDDTYSVQADEQAEPLEPRPGLDPWRPFTCPGCMLSLGVVQPKGNGVHLFKHRLSTTGSKGSLLRDCTVGSSFADLLAEESVSRSCFRFLFKDLNTEAPLCQIVLLNSDVHLETGTCDHQGCSISHSTSALKVTYQSSFGDEKNGFKHQADTNEEALYLPKYEVQALLSFLDEGNMDLPISCRTFQKAKVAYLPRST